MLFLRKRRIKMTTVAETQKMTSVDLFGLVGGYLGLFVGVSLTTIIEVVEFGIGWLVRRRCDAATLPTT